jgi:hypothetical protein
MYRSNTPNGEDPDIVRSGAVGGGVDRQYRRPIDSTSTTTLQVIISNQHKIFRFSSQGKCSSSFSVANTISLQPRLILLEHLPIMAPVHKVAVIQMHPKVGLSIPIVFLQYSVAESFPHSPCN